MDLEVCPASEVYLTKLFWNLPIPLRVLKGKISVHDRSSLRGDQPGRNRCFEKSGADNSSQDGEKTCESDEGGKYVYDSEGIWTISAVFMYWHLRTPRDEALCWW